MSLLPNLDEMTDNEKMAVLESIQKSIAESKEIQKQKIAANVDLVVQALKKIESDIRDRYDSLGNVIEKRVASIKDGKDGKNGQNGRDGKDGKAGRDGATGPRGVDGINGSNGTDGENGVSVVDAHIDFDGSLIIGLSSGRAINVGEVVAPDLAEKIKIISSGGGTSQYVLDTLASLQAQITALIPSQTGNSGKYLTTNGSALSWGSISGGLNYQGTWNASTNTPTLTSSIGVNGYYYITATAGSTNLNGITDWQIGDWLMFNGSVWQKIDQSNLVTSVAGRTGAITLTTADISALSTMSIQAANNVAITGGSITGITDLAVADGGTGASTAPNARTNLGLVIGTDVLAPTGSAASLTSFPTFNQNTTGTAANVTGTVAAANGGTGQTSYAIGDLLYASASTTLSKLADVATGNAVISGGVTTAPSWGKIGLTTHVSGTLPTANGGTNLTSFTANGVTYASSTSALATGSALTFDGTNLATTGSINSINTFGFKNRIINGGMVIDQRNGGASVTPTIQYTLDRWVAYTSAASKLTVQQNAGAITPSVGFSNYFGITSSSAYSVGSGDYFAIAQIIEGNNIADLNWGSASAKSVTLSFQIYSSLTGTFGGSLSNSAANRSYPFTYSIPVANTWTTINVTVAGDTSGTWLTTNGIGIRVQFGLGVGSTLSGTAGAWAAANYLSATGAVSVVGTSGATFYITGVQLEKGSTATSFDFRPYGTELALCQRYYYRVFPAAVSKPITQTGWLQSTGSLVAVTKFPVTMRTAPTALEQSGTANQYAIANLTTSSVCSAVPSFANSVVDTAITTFTTASVLVAGQGAAGYTDGTNGAGAYLGWSAEL